MNDADLEVLLRNPESDRVERKESLSDPDRVRQAICAFSNDLPNHRNPGVVFVGARDDGSCANLEITNDLLLRLGEMRDDGAIQPFPSVVVQKRTLAGCELAVIIVEPSSAPPVRFKGRTWIRVGPRRAIATAEEERRLTERRRGQQVPFDLREIPAATVEDLDLDLFQRVYLPSAIAPDVLQQNDRSREDQLKAVRFLGPNGTPTALGLLAVGIDSRRFLPGAYVQFLRIDGRDLADPVRDQKEVDGALPHMLRRLDEVIEANNSVATEIVGSDTEVRRPEYPIAALQQLTRNAALHRNYDGTHSPVRVTWFSDRIEIQSPGGPFGQVTAENFGSPGLTDYRNPHLAEAMKVFGFVQRFGVGLAIARRELDRNGNPAPEFDVEAGHILVRVRRRP